MKRIVETRRRRARTPRTLVAGLTGVCALALLPNSPLDGQEADRWTVSPDPVVEVGVVEGDSAYMFASVETARLLPDGRIVVADEGSAEIRVFDSRGAFQSEMGGAGEGPGEFESISGMAVLPPDTVMVWDPHVVRLTVYLADGSLVSTVDVPADPPGGPGGVLDILAGTFSDGDLALGWTVGQRISAREVVADRIVFGRFARDGHLRYLLGEGEGLHRYRGSPVPFSPFPHATVREDSVYFMNGVGGRIAVFDPEGRGVARTLEVPVARVGADEAWPAMREALREEGEDRTLEMVPDPRLEHTPSLGGFLADDRGLVWTKVYDPASDALYVGGDPWGAGGEWLIVTPEGETVARVAMPESVVPLQIHGSRLLGLRRGPLDVERIVIHEIRR